MGSFIKDEHFVPKKWKMIEQMISELKGEKSKSEY